MKKIFKLTLLLLLTACTVAPVNVTNTAQTLGEGNHQLSANIFPVLGVAYDYGINDRIDWGIGVERQIGILFHTYGKYNFHKPNGDGFSYAALAGLGYGISFARTKTVYGGGITSFRHDWFETYLALRYNYVHWETDEITTNDQDDFVIFPSTSTNFGYWQADFGFNFIASHVTTTLGVKLFQFPDGSAASPALGFAFKF